MTSEKHSTCAVLQEHYMDHTRGASGRLADRIQRHLAECEACSGYVAFVQDLQESAKATAGEEAGARLGFRNRLESVVSQAEESASPARRVRRAGAWAAGLAGVAVLVFGSILPGVPETLAFMSRLDTGSLPWIAGAIAGLLLLCSPLLLIRTIRERETLR